MSKPPARPLSLFIVCSRMDEEFLGEMKSHLAFLTEHHYYEVFDKNMIDPGQEYRTELRSQLLKADVILFMLSASSLDSTRVFKEDIPLMLARHARQEAVIVPFLVRECQWKETGLGRLQALPKNGKPVKTHPDRDAAYDELIRFLKKIATQKVAENTEPAFPKTAAQPRQAVSETKAARGFSFGPGFLKLILGIGVAGLLAIGGWLYFQKKEPVLSQVDSQKNESPQPQPTEKDIENNPKNDQPADSKSPEKPASTGEISNPPIQKPAGSNPEKASDFQLEGLKMLSIPGGTFSMGNDDGAADEQPVHTVSIRGFRLSKTEVTNEQFCQFLNEKGNSDGWLKLEAGLISHQNGQFVPKNNAFTKPVVGVNWFGANAFCNWLTEKTGRRHRLPTEAEWEYAARAGQNQSVFAGSETVENVAFFEQNSGGGPQIVARKAANSFGLHDMSGNVWEWCADFYATDYYQNSPTNNPKGHASGKNRVARGGSWATSATNCRTAKRANFSPAAANDSIGFRVAAD